VQAEGVRAGAYAGPPAGCLHVPIWQTRTSGDTAQLQHPQHSAAPPTHPPTRPPTHPTHLMLYTVSSLILAQVRSAFLRLKALWVPSIATARIVQLCAAATAGGGREGRRAGIDGGFSVCASCNCATCLDSRCWLDECATASAQRSAQNSRQRQPSPTCDGGGAGGEDDAVVGGPPQLDGSGEVALGHRLHVVISCSRNESKRKKGREVRRGLCSEPSKGHQASVPTAHSSASMPLPDQPRLSPGRLGHVCGAHL
jgi:hypothetical protein